MRQLFITTPFALGLALAACGGNVPSTSQIRADLENPSGSTKSKQSVAGAYTKNEASSTASGLAGSFSPIGGALTQAGKSTAVERVGIARIMGPHIARLQDRVQGRSSRALTGDVNYDACADNDEIAEELSASFLSGSTSGSFDVDIDLAACSGGDLTGTLAISGSFDVDQDSFVFDVHETMTNVCETGGDKYCITGEFDMEATMTNNTMELVTGWYATATWNEDGAARSLVTKGGIRVDIAGDTGLGAVEYLVYVKNEDGEEVSLVITIKTSADGIVYEIRGTDGSVSCTITADGSGSCDGDLSWDEAYTDSLEADASFSGEE